MQYYINKLINTDTNEDKPQLRNFDVLEDAFVDYFASYPDSKPDAIIRLVKNYTNPEIQLILRYFLNQDTVNIFNQINCVNLLELVKGIAIVFDNRNKNIYIPPYKRSYFIN
jgi:hypothetical protein